MTREGPFKSVPASPYSFLGPAFWSGLANRFLGHTGGADTVSTLSAGLGPVIGMPTALDAPSTAVVLNHCTRQTADPNATARGLGEGCPVRC